MNALAQPAARPTPDWFISEMPPGYQNRLVEIQQLLGDLQAMDRFGRLLWEVGPPLNEAVRDVFVALKFETELIPSSAGSDIRVRLDTRRRLLLHVSATDGTIQKKTPELAHVFQLLHEFAEDADRVVLVANSEPGTRPADRTEFLESDALNFLRRMGANFLAAPMLFKLWTLSLEDQDRARDYIERLHAQDGGIFLLPSIL